jgi:GntR family transcriptional regulator of arabinose operon
MNRVNDIHLSHDSYVSLHVQLHNQLQQLIITGRWAKGTRIPSETELTNHLKISRSTVRLALQQIELECLIERLPGKGTFVAYEPTIESPKQFIAFVTNDFANAEAVNLLNGAEYEIRKAGYHVTFNNVQNDQEQIELLTRLHEEKVAGLLIWPSTNRAEGHEEHAQTYQSVQLPIVFLDRVIPGVAGDCVTSDNYGGGSAIMQHLIELGHQRIVFLSHSRMDILPVAERYRAYQDTMWKAGLTPEPVWVIGDGEIGRTRALQASTDHKTLEFQQIRDYVLNAPHRPTAIFALNDYVAILALRVMKHMNIKVPQQMSIVGFDDVDIAAHLEVPLTTVVQEQFRIGQRAAQLLIDRLEGSTGAPTCEFIPTEIRVRSSTSVAIPV